MASIASPKLIDVQPAPTPAQSLEPSPAAAEQRLAQHAPATRNEVLPDKLLVRLDANAGRFVHTLTDSTTQEMLRRYPSEQQLAYSRAVMAYLRALSGG